MTPLLGTKTPSATAGDKPGEDRRAARAAAFQVFTKPETRDTAIGWRAAQASANSEVFTKHESRDTNHGFHAFSRVTNHGLPPPGLPPPPPGRCFPARCGAAWGGYGAAWAATVPRTGKTACWVFTKHESRDTAFTLYFPRFPTISHDFPVFPGISRPPPPPVKGPRAVRIGNTVGRVFTRHESRITAFMALRFAVDAPCGEKAELKMAEPKTEIRRPAAAFLRVVVRHGAAMARHGRRPSPAPATRPVGFSPATRHATWVFPVPPAAPGRATPTPANGFSRITRHESRPFLACFDPRVVRHAGWSQGSCGLGEILC